VLKTIKLIKDSGGEVRPSSYSPYHLLTKKSTLSEVSAMNRYTYKINSVEGLASVEYLKIIFNRDFNINED